MHGDMTQKPHGYQIIQGDCLAVLRTMETESVQCCVTSPPYFGLRDYGTANWEGGRSSCDHQIATHRASDCSTLHGGKGVGPSEKIKNDGVPFKSECGKCGAVRVDAQIGLEATPAEFVAKMVEVFEEVRRVLKKDGTLWLNLGDSYAGSGRGLNADGTHSAETHPAKQSTNRGSLDVGRMVNEKSFSKNLIEKGAIGNAWVKPPAGLKQKDLIGIPWRVAFALQDAGWWLRQDIIWSKPNPMPESVTDRCTKAHEYMFLLTKSAKYYYDNEAIKESCVYDDPRMYNDFEPERPELGFVGAASRGGGPLNKADSWKGSQFHTGKTAIHQLERSSTNRDRSLPRNRNGITGSLDAPTEGNTRNKRSVWTVTTQPYSEAHFATFPPKLIEPCILAGSREDDTVLDPFNGAGTTGLVSLRHRRNYVGIELNPEYIKIAEKRLKDVQVKLF